ncbi:MAG: GIY-YIG nuclease family protein, partial [Patescibacteria group bacterium]
MNKLIVEKIKTAPKTSGVYIFYNKKKPLYVGKAVNLKNRLAFYLKEDGDSKTGFLQKEADRVVLHRLSSGVKALIVESQLIKKLRPVYNILMADDKSYFYVSFTREKFPRIFITHKVLKIKSYKLTADLIGPFMDGQSLKIVLRALRRILPY